MKITKLAIIGLGSIGKRHLRLISEMRSDIEIVVVRSGLGKSCKEERIASKIFYSIADAINDGVQVAIISSPATFHLKQAIELAQNGVHLLIEKPISSSFTGVDKLTQITVANQLVVLVGYVLRYEKGAIKFKNWLSTRITGEILHAGIECGSYLPDWRMDQDYRKTVSASHDLGGGVLLELSHELDYLHWFFGKPVNVIANIRNSKTLDINVEDQADLLITSSEHYPITVQLDFNRRKSVRTCKVLTTEGELTWDAINKKVMWSKVNEEPEIYEYDNNRDYIYVEQLKHFLESVEKNIDPVVSISNGVDVVRLVDAARRASEKSYKIAL